MGDAAPLATRRWLVSALIAAMRRLLGAWDDIQASVQARTLLDPATTLVLRLAHRRSVHVRGQRRQLTDARLGMSVKPQGERLRVGVGQYHVHYLLLGHAGHSGLSIAEILATNSLASGWTLLLLENAFFQRLNAV
jgi:hypothetical protein